jgi:protein gp37
MEIKNSAIGWTGPTWNPWQGCAKKSSGCKNCYMYREKTRYGQDPKTVVRSKPATFNRPLKIQREINKGKRQGTDRLCFTCSWSDFFNQEADPWRGEAWQIMRQCPDVVFQVLTKLPQRIAGNLPPFWDEIKDHVWIGTTVEDMGSLWRLDYLTQINAPVRFVSFEPLIGSLAGEDENGRTLDRYLGAGVPYPVNWMLIGGESGMYRAAPGEPFAARPMFPGWVSHLTALGNYHQIKMYFKQWGDWAVFNPWGDWKYKQPGKGDPDLVYSILTSDGGIVYANRPAPVDPGDLPRVMIKQTTPMNSYELSGSGGGGFFFVDYKDFPPIPAPVDSSYKI